MRAVRLLRNRRPLEGATLDDPSPGPGEIAIEIHAAGICHSDVHYCDDEGRARLPVTPGHEVAGVIAQAGPGVEHWSPGDRVALHYLLPGGDMLGKERDGGYADAIVVPASLAVQIPPEVPFDVAAVMMCSTATAWHALEVAAFRPGESLGILGFGGLGVSAAQLAPVRGASRIVVVDVVGEKLRLAERWGASAVDGSRDELRSALTGLDVILDFAGHAPTTLAALRALAPRGRLIVVGIGLRRLELDPYSDLLVGERAILGSSDHDRDELVELMELARSGRIDLSQVITRRVPLDAEAVNSVFDDLRRTTPHLRTVILPRS